MSLPRRIVTVLAALVAAGGFALAAQGGRWWIVGEHALGPVSSERCFDGQCETTTLAWTGGGDIWVRAGTATWAAGMVSALVLVALAGAVAARASGRLAAAVALISTMTATVAGAVFMQARPEIVGATLGRGGWCYGLAIVCALGAALSTLRAPAVAAAATPSTTPSAA